MKRKHLNGDKAHFLHFVQRRTKTDMSFLLAVSLQLFITNGLPANRLFPIIKYAVMRGYNSDH